jgi:hypothetical protein
VLPRIFADGEGDFEGADFMRDGVVDADVEGELSEGQIDLLDEAKGRGGEGVVLAGAERHVDGLGEQGDAGAGDVVGDGVELERTVELAGFIFGKGDLAGGEAEEDLVADGLRGA